MKSFGNIELVFAGMPARLSAQLGRIDVGKGQRSCSAISCLSCFVPWRSKRASNSIRASNAIEGIDVPQSRAKRLADETPPRLRNRSEKEFAGYRDAIDALMRADRLDPPTPALMMGLHRSLYAYTKATGGRLKQADNVIGERDVAGDVRRVIFEPPAWQYTEGLVQGLFSGYLLIQDEQEAHPLVALAALILDLLAIHPFEDGNGRVARLLTTHELLRLGYRVARYVSIEQRIYEAKNGYYDALEESQRGWHEGEHSIWPWTEYLASVLADCYADFENRVVAARGSASMTKAERVRHWALTSAPDEFTLSDARRAAPGVSDPTIRLALRALRDEGKLEPKGSGRGAVWRRRPR